MASRRARVGFYLEAATGAREPTSPAGGLAADALAPGGIDPREGPEGRASNPSVTAFVGPRSHGGPVPTGS